MSRSSSMLTNPLSLILMFLALIWIFTIVKYCNRSEEPQTAETPKVPPSPIKGYVLLPKTNCPLKLSESDADIASALLQQYFRLDSLNRFQEAIWDPNPDLDPLFTQKFTGSWETYVECIQTLKQDAGGKAEKLALIASNFPDNDCHACAPYIGYLRFNIRNEDPATIVILSADRALFTFGAYGAIGDQISLTQLGSQQALIFSTAQTGQGYTLGKTTIYDINNFKPILELDTYKSNGGTDEADLYEQKSDLYIQANADTLAPAKLAMYQYTMLLGGSEKKAPEPETYFYEYAPDSVRYVLMR
ncbi:MAG: hypothetical protein R2824_03905 [Saprospiraceae bacterium]|nr:hypothetical protein [Lewinella sp.]